MNKLILLDFDGVITNINIDWDSLRKIISAKLGFPISSFNHFFQHNFNSLEFDRVDKIVEQYELQAIKQSKPFDDVNSFLEHISYPKFIVSMQSEKALLLFLKKYNLINYFIKIYGRHNFGSKKNQICNILSFTRDFDEIILIDDSHENCLMASRMGLSTINFNRKNGNSLESLVSEIY